jgi:hypothetical protein
MNTMVATIGKKIANGKKKPILEENTETKKRLVLTTAQDGQDSMQIDLYSSPSQAMTDAKYIGSLVVENLEAADKGEPSIEMVIASTAYGEISADAIYKDKTGEKKQRRLVVSLASLQEEADEYETPDFDIDKDAEAIGMIIDDADKKVVRKTLSEDFYEETAPVQKSKKKFLVPLIIAAAVLVIIAVVVAVLVLSGRTSTSETVRVTQVTPPPEQKQETAEAPVKPVVPITAPPTVAAPPAAASPNHTAAPPSRERTPAPGAGITIPRTIP